MTRRENFEKIAKAYYEAYYAQAIGLGKNPLSYEDWLETDKSMTPGFAEDNEARKCEATKTPEDNRSDFYNTLENAYAELVKGGVLARGTFDKFLESFKNFDKLKEIAKAVEKERGPAPRVNQEPPKSLNQDADNKEYNHRVWPTNPLINRPRETVYVRTPDGQNLYGDQAKQWLRAHGNDNPFSWFGDFWEW